MKHNDSRVKRIIIRIVTVIVAVAACAGTYLGYTYVIRMKHEPPTALTDTNTGPAVYQLNELKDVLAQFDDFYTTAERNNLENTVDYGTYVIPGLKATKTINLETNKVDMCTSMTPQSIAVTPDYLLVSGYCHTKEHSSVLFVIDKATHEYVKTVVLPGHSHVGGLAYDSENQVIWVSGRKHGLSYANSYTMEAIEGYSVDESQSPLAFRQMVPLVQLKQNSFMTYRDAHLYAGYFSQTGEGVLYKYALDDEGRLESSKPVESVDETEIENDDSQELKEKAAEEAAKEETKEETLSESLNITEDKDAEANSSSLVKKETVLENKSSSTGTDDTDAEAASENSQESKEIVLASSMEGILGSSSDDDSVGSSSSQSTEISETQEEKISSESSSSSSGMTEEEKEAALEKEQKEKEQKEEEQEKEAIKKAQEEEAAKLEEEEADAEDKFDPVDFVSMPSLVQGISFYGSDYLLVAESYGMMESQLRVFRNDENTTNGYSFTDDNAVVSYTLPDKLECACVADGKVYLVFEAAAYAYRVRPMYNIDRVLTLNINHDIAVSSRLIQ